MVTSAQEKQIQKYMRRIKDARDNDRDQEVVRARSKELIAYLEREGITDLY